MKVLLLSPHTDDVELGCGGMVVRFLEEGHSLFWVVFSVCEDSVPVGLPRDTLKQEFLGVVDSLGLTERDYRVFDYRVRHLFEVRQSILDVLDGLRSDFVPDLVVVPSLHDFHQDHQVVSVEAVRAFKTCCSVIGYELPRNHLCFDSVFFVKLDGSHVERKFGLLQMYKSQLLRCRDYFSRESVFGLCRVRGSQCGGVYAEAFEVIRWVI